MRVVPGPQEGHQGNSPGPASAVALPGQDERRDAAGRGDAQCPVAEHASPGDLVAHAGSDQEDHADAQQHEGQDPAERQHEDGQTAGL